ncbi:MAG: hypothetical protein N2Z69_03005 [Methylophilaceae bacterium]|nr:hypothetical protein [Methylophilaceae bacterium]
MMTGMKSFLARVAARLADEGWQVMCKEAEIEATRQVIMSRWLLGSRSVRLRLECCFDEAAKLLHFRQSASEITIGLPPPTLIFSSNRQHGLRLKENRIDRSLPEGGGEMHYGAAGEWLQALCDEVGWKLKQGIR